MNEPAYETTKNESDESWGGQVRPTECESDPGREGTPQAKSPRTGVECGGIPGGVSPWGSEIATHGSLHGGILRQLIETEHERLGEAQECITWYKKQVQKCEKRLAELAALERLEREQREKLNGH